MDKYYLTILLEQQVSLSDNNHMKFEKILYKLNRVILLASMSGPVLAAEEPVKLGLYDQKPWSLLYYYGQTVNGALLGIPAGNFKHWPEHIQSLELDKTLDIDNFLRRFLRPAVGIVQLSGNFTVRNGDNEPTIYEFDPYLTFRWANWAWDDKVPTSFALGWGVSYTSNVPAIERRGTNNKNLGHLLNYLMFEATFARPSYPELQAVIRIHHRSGAYGVYGVSNSGSNDIGLGIRYLF